jgi:hypothetical protein
MMNVRRHPQFQTHGLLTPDTDLSPVALALEHLKGLYFRICPN